MGIPRIASYWSPLGARICPDGATIAPSLLSYVISRLGGRWQSQGPDAQKKAGAIGENEGRLVVRDRLFGGLRDAEQHRDAAGIDRAMHIDRGVADEPDLRPRRNAAARKRHQHGRRIGLVGDGVSGADQVREIAAPAEMLSLGAKKRAGLVADHREVDSFRDKPI